MVIIHQVLAILAALLLLVPMMAGRAHAVVYVWKDANGVTNFTDHPAKIPTGVKVEVRTYYDQPSPMAEVPAPDVVTQGEFVRQLAAELGLGEGLTSLAAARLLSRVGIAPRLGAWDLDKPLEEGLLGRLRTLTVAAAHGGRLPLLPQEALFAFDSAAALVGIALRDVAAGDVPEVTRRFVEEPVPPVYVAPPPAVIHERVIVLGGDAVAVHDPLIHPHKVVINVDSRIIKKRVVHRRPVRKAPMRNAKPPRQFRHKVIRAPIKEHRYYPQPRQAKVHRRIVRGTLASVPRQKRTAFRRSVVRSHPVPGATARMRVQSSRLITGKRVISLHRQATRFRATAGSHAH